MALFCLYRFQTFGLPGFDYIVTGLVCQPKEHSLCSMGFVEPGEILKKNYSCKSCLCYVRIFSAAVSTVG